jgi:hypothetical protein
MSQVSQLISYIAPGAPATRRPADGTEPFVRAEIGFTPAWYRQHLEIDFGRPFHTDPEYRRNAMLAMRRLLCTRFAGVPIGRADSVEEPLDLLTGVFGACSVAAIYGVRIVYAADNWPTCAQQYLTDEQVDRLEPPDLENNPHFQAVMKQVDWIAASEGIVTGYVNWQGVLNNAQRLRGQQLFFDLLDAPERARHLFACVCQTMIDAARRVYARQRETGFNVRFSTISNCLVNMIAPQQYEQLLLPFDRQIAEAFGCIGIHNCAWSATPYLELYARVPHVAYIDMGLDSDLRRAQKLFPAARRAVMITPMDVAGKPLAAIEADIVRIADQYGPCDLVLADIDAGVPDERIKAIWSVVYACSARESPRQGERALDRYCEGSERPRQ